jgi:hypothetical protein
VYGINTRHVMICTIAVLGGCTSLNDPVAIDWEHGAKRGTVIQLFDATTPKDRLPFCLTGLPATDIALNRYVEIDYRHVRHMFREVGALPANLQVKPGDVVEFYPGNCHQGSRSTISRLLPNDTK